MSKSIRRSAFRFATKPPETPEAAPKAVTSAYVDPTQVYGDKGQNFDAKVLSGTKFGDLVLDGSEFVIDGKQIAITNDEAQELASQGKYDLPYKATNLNLNINGQNYTFHPKNVLEKGFVADGKQFYNASVLKNLDQIYEQGQAVNLKDVGWYDDFLKKNDLSTEGILLPAGELNFKVGSGGEYKIQKIGNPSSDGRVLFNEITGIGKVGDQYVYTTDLTKVDATDASGYYDQSGQGQAQWTKEKGGLVGSASRAIAKVPFLPEIAGAITAPTGYGPYVYATLKGLQGGATGRDPLKVGLQAGATILAADLASGLLKGTPAGAEGGFPADYNVEPYGPGGIPPDIAPPALPPVDYSLLDGANLPTPAPGMGGGTGIIEGSSGMGLQQPTMPNLGGMGGGQGLTVPVAGGTVGQLGFTPSGATPSIGSPKSFINDPNVLGTDVIPQGTPNPISLGDASRALRLASGIKDLVNPPSAGGGGGGVDQGGGQPTMAGVDYSGLYNLLAQRASGGGLLGTRYQPQPLNLASLLG